MRKVHHKLLVIDERMVIAGSFNYTEPATILNDENIVVLGDLEETDVARPVTALNGVSAHVFEVSELPEAFPRLTAGPLIAVNHATRSFLLTSAEGFSAFAVAALEVSAPAFRRAHRTRLGEGAWNERCLRLMSSHRPRSTNCVAPAIPRWHHVSTTEPAR